MATESKKRLALAIIDFLSTCVNDGTFPSDERESIEVAQSCIAESFGVDPNDKAAVGDALGGANLMTIYGVYEKLKDRGPKPPNPRPGSTATAASPTAPAPAQKQEAEALKGQGNSAMAKKDYATAITLYTKALELVPQNPIYLSNRAAAYSASLKHEQAKADAQAAVEADPKYTKAWSRLGLAKFALGDAKGSMEAYQKGIDFEGSGGSEAMRKGYETAKKRVEEEGSVDDIDNIGSARSGGVPGGGGFGGMPDLSGLASMLGGGAGGGPPDLSSLMSNPMFSSAAQSLMNNPELLGSLMSNPRLREMADSFGSGGRGGGGMPDIASLMSDPGMAEIITTSAKSKVKSSTQRAIRAKVAEQFPLLAPHLDEIMPKKSQLDVVKVDRTTLYLSSSTPLFFQPPHSPNLLPHLLLVHKFPAAFPHITVDRGAIRFVLSGASLMIPGLISPGGWVPEGEEAIGKGEVVVVRAEGKEEVCAVGVLSVGTGEMRGLKKGVAVEGGHMLGDGLWRFGVEGLGG
ncbi:hypothetical protein FGG08_005580 [Glutinoglossum americanum]|uniref:PUA domain-containing protein n=1 Tax=Glutinoglossum americanum TaxID=1670608 RepID=A0A9P8KYD0_9PEZI|nr:hypothetical protein FGG08_005580 [Glutinoglossum americanum]